MQLALGVRPPCQAGNLVNGGGISGGGGRGMELFGEHSFSVRGQAPPKGAHDFDKAPPQPKMALASDDNFGEYQDCHIL